MKQKVVTTQDGSKTIHLPELNENYHSSHGALQEAVHVFIMNGIELRNCDPCAIFEMGFGTGLNAILAYRNAKEKGREIRYAGVEAFPVEEGVIKELDYSAFLTEDEEKVFEKMHEINWGEEVKLAPDFSFKKVHAKIEEFDMPQGQFDVIFFDAFGPRVQGDLWKPDVLRKMYNGLKTGGLLTTYCAQGQFKRDLKSCGFRIEPMPGPPGKREMTIGWKD